jgi:hypothetical protein
MHSKGLRTTCAESLSKSTKCVPSMENKFCVGTPECVKNEFNNYCKPVEHTPTRPTDCEQGGAVGKNLGVLYREALSTGQASPASLRQSAECLSEEPEAGEGPSEALLHIQVGHRRAWKQS